MSSNLPVLIVAAYGILKNELDNLPGGPRSAAEMLDRLTTPPDPGAATASPLANTGALLTIPQAAKRLGVCAKSVQNWARSGKLARVKIGKTVRIPESALADLLAAGKGV